MLIFGKHKYTKHFISTFIGIVIFTHRNSGNIDL